MKTTSQKVRAIKFPAMEGNCEYCGYDFSIACRRVVTSKARLFESNVERGYLIVLTDAQESKMFGPSGEFRPEWAIY